MKRLTILFMAMTLSLYVVGQSITLPPSGDNEKASVTQMIGLVSVTINYSSPDVHGPNGEDRTGHIWGELVPYGFTDPGYGTSHSAPWRVGANENTTITFSHDVLVEGKSIKAGTYGLFLDVQPDKPWTWIFNRENTNWGHYHYDPAMDALRVSVTPTDAPYTEWLSFNFDERKPSSTVATFTWEKKKASFKIEVPNINELYVEKIRGELQGHTMGFDRQQWMDAATFCAANKINLPEALTWAEYAIAGRWIGVEDFKSLLTKSIVLDAMGKRNDAAAVVDKAMALPSTTVQDIHEYGKSLLSVGKNEQAMNVFTVNKQKFPKDKFTPYVGLARAYAALGDKKNAIKHWEIALQNVPAEQSKNRKYYEDELKKLKG